MAEPYVIIRDGTVKVVETENDGCGCSAIIIILMLMYIISLLGGC